MKKFVIIFSLATVAFILLASCVVDRIPPRAMTATRLDLLKGRVLQYAQANGQLPASLAVLPPMEGYDSSVQDGWKRDIVLELSASGIVSFRSLGQDAAVGGLGEDADIVRSFPSRDARGKWSDERVQWTEDTFKR